MIRHKFFGAALLVSLLALSMAAGAANAQSTTPPAKKRTTQSKKPPVIPPKPDLEPRAIALLKASSDRLAAAHSLSFTAVEIFEHPSRHGHPLAYATKSDVTLQRPDRLRVIISGDGPASEFYYDGKIMSAFAPAENLVAVANAPPTIDATRHQLDLSSWQLDFTVPGDAFGSSRAANAKRIPFAHPHPQTAPGAKPPVKAKPPKAKPQ